MKIAVRFGAMAPPIHKQLGLPKTLFALQQTSADAIARLAIHGLLSEAEVHRARQRLMKQILRQVPVSAGRAEEP